MRKKYIPLDRSLRVITPKKSNTPLRVTEQLFEHHQFAFHLAFRILGNRVEAEDVVQDTFLLAGKKLSRIEFSADLKGWFFRFVLNLAMTKRRSIHRRRNNENAAGREAPKYISNERELNAHDLNDALFQLSEKHRVPFSMYYEMGFTHSEIAGVLQISKRAVYRRMNKALNQLQRLLSTDKKLLSSAALFACLPGLQLESPTQDFTYFMQSKLLANDNQTQPPHQSLESSYSLLHWNCGIFATLALVATIFFMDTDTIIQNKNSPSNFLLENNDKMEEAIQIKSMDTMESSKENSYHQIWEFSNGEPSDIQLLGGQWKWEQKNKCFSANLSIADYAYCEFPKMLGTQPVQIDVQFSVINSNYFNINIALNSHEHRIPHTFYSRRKFLNIHKFSKNKIFNGRWFFWRNYIVLTLENSLSGVLVYHIPFTNRHINIGGKNIRLHRLEYKTISIEEIPKQYRKPKELIKMKRLMPELVQPINSY